MGTGLALPNHGDLCYIEIINVFLIYSTSLVHICFFSMMFLTLRLYCFEFTRSYLSSVKFNLTVTRFYIYTDPCKSVHPGGGIGMGELVLPSLALPPLLCLHNT